MKGIGIDIVSIQKYKLFYDRNKNCLQNIFTVDEIKYCENNRNSIPHYAVRFAAKESFIKALSEMSGWDTDWAEIEVIYKDDGRPGLIIKGSMRQLCLKKGISNVMISLSYSENYAIANCVLT